MSNTTDNKKRVSFASLDPYIQQNIILPVEKNISAKNLVEWGTGNRYPDYLLDLYNNVPTLRSIINGNIDFITGDGSQILALPGLAPGVMNRKGDTIAEQLRDIAKDYEIYGGFALQILRNMRGEVAEIYYLDMRYLRTNKNADVFYYCEEWNKAGRKDCIEYPKFNPALRWETLADDQKARNASSVLFVKNVHTQVYPAPLYSASVKACEIERMIDNFHINSLENGFVSSAIINFNGGIPDDNMKAQIEEDFNEKFSGADNAGRIMFSWNRNKASATDITEFKVEDFGERYKALSDHSRQQIFTAFRANPALFGIPTEDKGFSSEEYSESFKLYNRTQIRPVQRLICDAYDKIYGVTGVLTIKPFSIEGETETKVN